MTVVLSMYQLGVMIQRILDEIDSAGFRLRQNLAYVLAVVYIVALSAFTIYITLYDESKVNLPVVDLVFSLPLFIICGCVFLFTRARMQKL